MKPEFVRFVIYMTQQKSDKILSSITIGRFPRNGRAFNTWNCKHNNFPYYCYYYIIIINGEVSKILSIMASKLLYTQIWLWVVSLQPTPHPTIHLHMAVLSPAIDLYCRYHKVLSLPSALLTTRLPVLPSGINCYSQPWFLGALAPRI